MGKVIVESGSLEVRELAQLGGLVAARPSKPQRRRLVFLLVVFDVLTFGLGLIAAHWTAHHIFQVGTGHFLGGSMFVVTPVLLAYLAIYWAYGLYNTGTLSCGGADYRSVGNANAIGLVAAVLIVGLLSGWTWDVRSIVPFWFFTTCATLAGRFIMRRYIYAQKRKGRPVERTLILGANDEGIAIAAQLAQSPRSASDVVAFLDDAGEPGAEPVPGVPVLGRMANLEATIRDQCIDSVLIASPHLLKEFFAKEERALEILSHVEVQMAWGGFDLLTTGLRIKEEANVPLVVLNKTRIRGIHAVLKNILDYVVAAVLLALCAIPFLVLALLVKLDSKGPVIHRRRVVGVGGKRFDAFKFRTMQVDGDRLLTPEMKEEWRTQGKIKDDPRITRMGRFLRKYSLDELPQLMNVLRGEMSLIGPRMITPEEMAHFGRWHHSRNLVKPGLTGLWQISGRSDLSYDDRAKLDIYYIRNHSFWLDLRIFVMTIPAILSGRGAS